MGRSLGNIYKKDAIFMSGNEAADFFAPILGVKRWKFLKLIDDEKFIAGKIRGRKLVHIQSVYQYIEKTTEERETCPPQIGLREYWKEEWENHLKDQATAVEIAKILGISSKTVKRFINSNVRSIKKNFRYNGRGFDVDEINPGYLAMIMRDINE
ncbi:MAG: hypothetical protein ACRCU6_04125 [Fusobacteriaceae bacterium]